MERHFDLYEHQAQYYETDQMGIIHHSNYIRWFEEARTNLLDQMGFGYAKMEESGVIVPVLAINCIYKSMVRYNDRVYIIPKIEEFNGIRLTISYRIVDKSTGELRTTGESKHCFLNKENRPFSLKKEQPKLYDLFDSYLKVDLSIPK
ncbi:acyl-CoA thioesterase [Carnobacterium inhibens]|uniref:Acyl-CoA thioester hydrolase n=1 Tax=Carnobacterium inhibens subsp. gilichinskyi TaxID=1266845 RepID=U5SEH7_9LACT|nr:acyl-CoA thioesterase [Carnobacterium inhibens]AGY82267.1 acyl-CoA thioester hydrolase [Carnobacterium inhibens subsp. gilichinskyi]